MERLILYLMLIVPVPASAFADINPQAAKNKPEVSLSEPAIAPPSQTAAKMMKKKKRVRSKKISFEESTNSALIMSEEEQQIMQARNDSDRYRTPRRKPREQQAKQQIPRQLR